MSLIEKIRKARESVVEVDGKKFTIRRPTEAEMSLMLVEKSTRIELIRKFVVGWNLQEIDLIPGGDPIPVVFDSNLWAEYVDDKASLWAPIADAINASIADHNEKVERAEKK
jgi:hypothetical protein